MIYISHRGNLTGRIPNKENYPEYIDEAITAGFDVEVDIWLVDKRLYLGHDEPQYEVDNEWLVDRVDKLWVHCKNVEALNWIRNTILHYFWHENDTLTLTSKQYVWVYPGKQPIFESIAVMPEIHNDRVNKCAGICSDFVEDYKNKTKK
jgi:hypothetical protein